MKPISYTRWQHYTNAIASHQVWTVKTSAPWFLQNFHIILQRQVFLAIGILKYERNIIDQSYVQVKLAIRYCSSSHERVPKSLRCYFP